MSNPKRVFISYSHDSPSHKQWVLKLAHDLRTNGADATLDQWDLSPGEDIAVFMEQGLKQADRVVVVCSQNYVERANTGTGGVAYEKMIVNAELIEDLGTKKFIPIIRKSGDPPVPAFLGYRLYIDFEEDEKYQSSLDTLLREIHDIPDPEKPPIGLNPYENDSAINDLSTASTAFSTTEDFSDQTVSSTEELSEDSPALVDELKKIISDPSTHPMKLNELLMPLASTTREGLEQSSLMELSVQPTEEEFRTRIKTADEITAKLVHLFAIGCHWANIEQSKIFSKALASIAVAANPSGSFFPSWDHVSKYPVLRVLYAGGIAAYANSSYDVLYNLLIDTKVRTRTHQALTSLILALHSDSGFAQDVWKWLPDRERHYMPVSDYLEETLHSYYSEFFPVQEDFKATFDRFELFQALVYGDLHDEEKGWGFWAPLGSWVWRGQNIYEQVRIEINTKGTSWQPLEAGFFSGTPDRAIEVLDKLIEFAGRVRGQLGIY